MRYLAAYMLLRMGGHENIEAKDIKKVLGAVGAEVDDAQIDALLRALDGKSLDEVIAQGREKMESLPVAGVAVAGGAAAAAAAAAGGATAADAGGAAAAKEEEKEEEKEESDEDLGFGLFD
ncbi:hypothetical protein CDCA_CDCA13G3627 [Cyanidium caldarium]|uniref:60S acidic ribosomal protein P2 n=1 Tax=Cyanidium caldarium TaxID=2771 RepID=A0AAV9IZ35_CYACA|nr:hypothetical protein CDCA_CDCA13G3627 [Cyanidium caldarium]